MGLAHFGSRQTFQVFFFLEIHVLRIPMDLKEPTLFPEESIKTLEPNIVPKCISSTVKRFHRKGGHHRTNMEGSFFKPFHPLFIFRVSPFHRGYQQFLIFKLNNKSTSLELLNSIENSFLKLNPLRMEYSQQMHQSINDYEKMVVKDLECDRKCELI